MPHTSSPVSAVTGTGSSIDMVQVNDGVANRARQSVAIGDPDTWGNIQAVDSHSSAQVKLYDAAGNPLLVNPSDAQVGTDLLAVAPMRWNGTNWDRWNNSNQPIPLLATAARTSTTAASFTNYNWPGIALTLNITAIPGSAPSLQVYLQAAGGILCPLDVAVTALGLYTYIFAPGSTATPYGAVNGVQAIHPIHIPGGLINPVVAHGNANSVTYTLTGYPVVNS